MFSLCVTCFTSAFVLKAEFTEQPREEENRRQSQVRGLVPLEGVASGGRFVIFVALQGEGRNANIKVGTIGSFDTERPPEDKCKMRSMLQGQQNNSQCIISTLNR